MLSLCLVTQRGMRVTPLGFFFRIILKEKPQNLEKTTSSVLFVLLLIYALHIIILHFLNITIYLHLLMMYLLGMKYLHLFMMY